MQEIFFLRNLDYINQWDLLSKLYHNLNKLFLQKDERYKTEIFNYFKRVGQNDEIINKRKLSLEKLRYYLNKEYPDYQMIIFGSLEQGIFHKYSDIDITFIKNLGKIKGLEVIQKTSKNQSKKENITVLNKIRGSLWKNKDYDKILIIKAARVPIIKFRCKKYDISYDLSVNAEDGIENSQLIKKIINENGILK